MVEYKTHFVKNRDSINNDRAKMEQFGWIFVSSSEMSDEYLVKYARDNEMPYWQELKDLEEKLENARSKNSSVVPPSKSKILPKVFGILSGVSFALAIMFLIGYFVAEFWGADAAMYTFLGNMIGWLVAFVVFVILLFTFKSNATQQNARYYINKSAFNRTLEEVETRRSEIMSSEEMMDYLNKFKTKMNK